jgi:hypothetical protein
MTLPNKGCGHGIWMLRPNAEDHDVYQEKGSRQIRTAGFIVFIVLKIW